MRGFPGVLTRRRLTAGVIVVATGGVATVAVAAGPVVYSEYTTGGDRESRIAQQDGGDSPLPKDVTGAAVSPDGRRIAQTTLVSSGLSSDDLTTTLRVTAGDGSAPVTVLEEQVDDERGRGSIVTGLPVWSPDGAQVIVQRSTIRDGSPQASRRVVCVVDTRVCRDGGAVPRGAGSGEDGLRGDVLTWQAQSGPLVRTATRGGTTTIPSRVRCGRGAATLEALSTSVQGLPGSSFGAPIVLRGTPSGSGASIDPASAGVLAVPEGTLVHDAPAAKIRRGRLRCARGFADASLIASTGMQRLRLRAGGSTRTLPTPQGLRSGDGLRLVGTDAGGAFLISTRSPSRSGGAFCDRVRKRVATGCRSGGFSSDPARESTLRVWRWVPGPSPRFDRVLTARRSALKTLADATDVTVASGEAVLAVTDGAIERVPLDGGVPTTVARGRGIRLDVSAW